MAAGSFAKVTGTGVALPGTSFATVDWGNITTDADSILSESSGVYTPQSEGYYLIIAEGEHESTHNNRQNIQIKIQRNDADYAGAWNDGYSRNTANSLLWVRAYMIAHFNGSTDDFRIQYRRDAGAGTPAGTFNDQTIKVIQLSEGNTSSLPYGHYGTPTSQSGHTNTWTQVAGLDVITESDTSVIQIGGGNLIELKEADRPYLFVYSMVNSDSGAGRTHRVVRARHNADPIWNSLSSEYQRNAADQYASPAGMGLVRPGTANQDLDFEIIGYTIGSHWGTWDAGSWALSAASGEAGIMVIALPSTVDIAIFEDETAAQSVSGTGLVDINAARTTVGIADSPFTRDNNTDVTVSAATDILSHAAFLVERSTAEGTRWTGGVRHEIEGTDNAESRGGGYERGDQSSDDCMNAAIATTYLGAVALNDTLQIEKFSPDGNDGGGTFQTLFAGWFLIDLETLGGAAPQTLDGVLFSKAPSFIAGAVTTAYTLAGSLFSQAPGFIAGTITTTYALDGVLFSKPPAFTAGTVSTNYTLDGVLFASGPSFIAGTISTAYSLGGVLFSKVPAFVTGTITTTYTLDGVLFSAGPSFIAGVVSSTYSIDGVLFSKPPSFLSGTITTGYTLTGVLFSSPPSFISGQINLTIHGVLFSKPPSFISGTLAGPLTGLVFSKPPSFISGSVSQVGTGFTGWGIPAAVS